MRCANCREDYDHEPVENRFCSLQCEVQFDHEMRLREKRYMSVHLCELDDGSVAVEIAMREPNGFSELTRNFEDLPSAMRGLALLCTTSAHQMETNEE